MRFTASRRGRSSTWTEVPHITYVDAVDVSELERLREHLNNEPAASRGVRLTLLPFIAKAIALACAEQPRLNAHYDASTETLTTFDAVDLGVATQTDQGLLVPVIRDVGSRGLRNLAAELARVTQAARDGSATRHELIGSTITVTSLGAIGGLVTTPILNAPEVAIVGVNKIEIRPVWHNGAFEPRQMLNLSSSFDHRMRTVPRTRSRTLPSSSSSRHRAPVARSRLPERGRRVRSIRRGRRARTPECQSR